MLAVVEGKAEPFRLEVPPYDLVLMPDDRGTFFANVPALPEVVAYGAIVARSRPMPTAPSTSHSCPHDRWRAHPGIGNRRRTEINYCTMGRPQPELDPLGKWWTTRLWTTPGMSTAI